MKKVIIVLLFLASNKTSAQNPVDWKKLGESGAGDVYFQQFTHKKITQDLIDVWDRTNIKKYEQKKKGKVTIFKTGVFMISLKRYDCSERKLQTLQFTLYDSKGSLISTNSDYESFEYATPGSAGELLLNNACRMIGK
jgi:hypothetical protein